MRKRSLFYVFLNYIVYWLSFLAIRKKNRYTFGGPQSTFKGNAKYFFIYSTEHSNADVAWLTRSQKLVDELTTSGLQAYSLHSFRGIWHALTSKYWFYNSYFTDIVFCLSGGAQLVNLWHGVGIKCIEHALKSGPLVELRVNPTFNYRIRHPELYKNPSFVLSSNPFQTAFFSASFSVPASRCLEFGYPRNWILKADEKARTDFINHYESQETIRLIDQLKRPVSEGGFSKVFIYMPTWRDTQRELFTQSMDLNRFNHELCERNELLILKPHPMMRLEEEYADFSNIIILSQWIDVYSVLPYTQILITDYSSVIYDYLLIPNKTSSLENGSQGIYANRSVILYIFDYEDYIKERALFYPFDENVVGRRVYDFEELMKVISEGDYALLEKDRRYLVDRFWGESQNYDSSRKILEYFDKSKTNAVK